MVKKNRHRAGRKKRERILRAQQRALELEASNRPTVLVLFQQKEPLEPENLTPEPAVPIIDLTDEDPPFFVKSETELPETNNE